MYPISTTLLTLLKTARYNFVLSETFLIIKSALFSSYQLNAQFLYSITIYMLQHNPQHVLSSTMLFFRRTNCIITASGIVTLGKLPYSMPVESGLQLQSALNRHTVRLFTESDCSPLSTGILYGRLQRVTIPEAVIIQFVLLKMSKVLLETC